MTRLHFFALSERWISAANNDAFVAERFGDHHLFGIAEGLSDQPGLGSASGIAVSSAIDGMKGMIAMKGSPADTLVAAVHESEARILKRLGGGKKTIRDATHLSAAVVDESLACTLLDTGEGHALLIGESGAFLPQEYPGTRPSAGTGGNPHERKGNLQEMISRTLGGPRVLKPSDIVTFSLLDTFLLLSSGGLHDYLGRDRIAGIIRLHGENVETACQQMVREAQTAGSERTITIVLAHGHRHPVQE